MAIRVRFPLPTAVSTSGGRSTLHLLVRMAIDSAFVPKDERRHFVVALSALCLRRRDDEAIETVAQMDLAREPRIIPPIISKL
jgi:hypothetical protein